MGPGGDRRQQAGRLGHRRLRRGAADAGRWPHAVPGRHRHAGRQPAAARHAALRRAARPRAADAAVSRHLRAARRRAQPLAQRRRDARSRTCTPRCGELCEPGARPRQPVAIETFARAAGVQLLHVPFKDAGAAFTAVAAGDVDFTAFGLNTVAGLIAGGKLRALAVAARQRLVAHPELPTLPESGGPAVEMHPWAALVARAGAPQPVLEQLQRDIVAALSSTDVVSRAELAGFEITPSTPQALRERIAADRAAVAPLVAEGRIARL
ncbi:hypothetical protein FSC37_01625 [Piscinibacter aquaticus]|uniref:Tripartite tricarboxylate transporter substrate binding protein n=1 Tax=Piscinibacter aquaticus TaxID=392597 RepID=A0A5C6TYB9_9BURK|nr:hypothetical protein FSC37_01625 [Piscinibacter aquaticus]